MLLNEPIGTKLINTQETALLKTEDVIADCDKVLLEWKDLSYYVP
jgi:hypothetical protein